MSMSQEEIEALMNGLDIGGGDDEPADTASDDSNDALSQDDIAALMAQTTPSSSVVDDDDLDALINQYSSNTAEIPVSNTISDDDLDSILSGISGIKDEPVAPPAPAPAPVAKPAPKVEAKPAATKEEVNIDHEAIAKNWTDKQIDSGIFPLPVESHNKVVNQLHQVAQDGEEQATKIFDVLSFLLDENNLIQKNAKSLEEFVTKQTVLLENLNAKFPHIELFAAHLAMAKSVSSLSKEIRTKVDDENNHLFEAMELMQFHDINRQKIERVMSVIKKLANYLNNLFEDETGVADVKIAKHIHGDSNSELMGNDDLEALIAEFGK